MILSKRCEVRYCQEKQSWRLYDENDNPIPLVTPDDLWNIIMNF